MLDNYIFLKCTIKNGLDIKKIFGRDYIRIKRGNPVFISNNNKQPIVFVPIKNIYYHDEILSYTKRNELELVRVDELLLEIESFIVILKNISKEKFL